MPPIRQPTEDQPKLRRPHLAKLANQWRAGEKREVMKIQERAFRAFSAEVVGRKPNGLRSHCDMLDLFLQYRHEFLAATEPPFDDGSDPEDERAKWREMMVEAEFIIPVPYGDDILHVQEMFLYGLRITEVVFETAWLTYWSTQPSGKPPHDYWVGEGDEAREEKFFAQLREHAQKDAAFIRERIASGKPLADYELLSNPPLSWHSLNKAKKFGGSAGQRTASAPPTEPSPKKPEENSPPSPATKNDHTLSGLFEKWGPFHKNWGAPPANPDPNEPFMRDGSHLLASERGRRKIDPVTGKRMIRQMVLTPDAWPHYEWIEDVEGEFGVGPHGPECSFGIPDDPQMLSPRESVRPYLEKMGRMDLLHCFMPGPNDPDQSNPPEPYFCYPKDWPKQSK